MTADLDDLATLRTYDVSQRRARHLRRRCHAALQGKPPATFRPFIVPALGGAWCLAYLVEIIRCTAAIYGRFGAP
jgi:hypothetical protein